jgi:hypothetical protein
MYKTPNVLKLWKISHISELAAYKLRRAALFFYSGKERLFSFQHPKKKAYINQRRGLYLFSN